MGDPKDRFRSFGPSLSSVSPLLRMRQPDLSPLDRGQAMAKVDAWLEGPNKSILLLLPQQELVRQVRTALGPELVNTSELALRNHLAHWRVQNHPQSMKGQSSLAEPDFVRKLRKEYSTIQKAFRVEWHGGSAAVTASGLISEFDHGKLNVAVPWSGAVELKIKAPKGTVFSASVGPNEWCLKLIIGQKAPDISKLKSVFEKGDVAVRAVLGNMDAVSLSDPSKARQLFSSQMGDVKNAVEAAMQVNALRPGAVNFGFFVKGDSFATDSKDRHGTQAGVLLTVIF